MAFENFYATRLFTDVGANDDAITLEKAPSVASGRLVLEPRNPSQREIISFTGVNGTQITGVSRGQGGTTAKPHSKGALVEMNVTAEDMNDIYDLFDTGNVMINTAKLARFEGGAGIPNSVGVLGDTKYYTTVGDSTWTKPENLKFIEVTVLGGGGGGGGGGGLSNLGTSGGGGGGGAAIKKILASELSSAEVITIGEGGAGGSSDPGSGSSGGTTSFGSHVSASGGEGNHPKSGAYNIAVGGVGSGGDFNMRGGNGLPRRFGSSQVGFSAKGGDAPLGLGFGGGGEVYATEGQSNPSPVGYGAGGGGIYTNAATGLTGRPGTSGLVIVREYF